MAKSPSKKIIRAAKKATRASKERPITNKERSRTAKERLIKTKERSRIAKERPIKNKERSRTTKERPIKAKERTRTAKERSIKAKESTNTSPDALITEPNPFYKPEFMGKVYALTTNIPDYMPKNEADLMVWAKAYIDNTAAYIIQFPTVFSNTAPFPHNILLPLWTRINNARNYIQALADILRSWRTLNRIYLHASEHKLTTELGIPPAPPASGGTVSLWAGLIGIIDAQVRMLRVQPNFNQAIAELFGIVPKKPGSSSADSFELNLRGKFTGAFVRLTFRSAANIKEAVGVRILCDRGNGHFEIVSPLTTSGHFEDWHPLPARACAWLYIAELVGANNAPIGLQSTCEVLVAPRVEPKA